MFPKIFFPFISFLKDGSFHITFRGFEMNLVLLIAYFERAIGKYGTMLSTTILLCETNIPYNRPTCSVDNNKTEKNLVKLFMIQLVKHQ